MSFRTQRGFTFVEAMIAGGLVTIGIYFLFHTLSSAFNQDSINDKLTNGRLLAAKVASEAFAHPGYFPTLKRANAAGVEVVGVYIHCFDRKGQPLPTVFGANRSALLFLDNYNSSANACSNGSVLEVRVLPLLASEEFQIDVVDLKPNQLLSGYSLLSTRKIRKTHFL